MRNNRNASCSEPSCPPPLRTEYAFFKFKFDRDNDAGRDKRNEMIEINIQRN